MFLSAVGHTQAVGTLFQLICDTLSKPDLMLLSSLIDFVPMKR